MNDILVIGNISIDLFFKGKSLTQTNDRFQLAIGGKYFTDFFHVEIGGGAANVAVGLTKLGYNVAIFGKIGNNPFKQIILDKLHHNNINTDNCQFDDDYYKISTILLSNRGERTIINYETPSHLIKPFLLNSNIKKAHNVYFAPLPNLPLTEKIAMINFFSGDQVMTFINLSASDCQQPIDKLTPIFNAIDVLIINSHEFASLVKIDYQKINFNDLTLIANLGLQNKVVIITDADKGSYGYFNGKYYYQKAITPETIVDTTGAGDGYTAGFIAQYLRNQDIIQSMKSGAQYAAFILGKLGAN